MPWSWWIKIFGGTYGESHECPCLVALWSNSLTYISNFGIIIMLMKKTKKVITKLFLLLLAVSFSFVLGGCIIEPPNSPSEPSHPSVGQGISGDFWHYNDGIYMDSQYRISIYYNLGHGVVYFRPNRHIPRVEDMRPFPLDTIARQESVGGVLEVDGDGFSFVCQRFGDERFFGRWVDDNTIVMRELTRRNVVTQWGELIDVYAEVVYKRSTLAGDSDGAPMRKDKFVSLMTSARQSIWGEESNFRMEIETRRSAPTSFYTNDTTMVVAGPYASVEFYSRGTGRGNWHTTWYYAIGEGRRVYRYRTYPPSWTHIDPEALFRGVVFRPYPPGPLVMPIGQGVAKAISIQNTYPVYSVSFPMDDDFSTWAWDRFSIDRLPQVPNGYVLRWQAFWGDGITISAISEDVFVIVDGRLVESTDYHREIQRDETRSINTRVVHGGQMVAIPQEWTWD